MLQNAIASAKTEPLRTGGHIKRKNWPVPFMAESIVMKPRTLWDLCSRERLPPPGDWEVFCRLLAHALLIQAAPRGGLTALAIHLGYSDSQAFSHAYQRHFGLTPSFVQERLGWQWLIWKWLGGRKHLYEIGT
jgi:AraC-like DNA-binding protein